jgi:hypothetical protein
MHTCPLLVVAVVSNSPLPGVEYREYTPGDRFCPARLVFRLR